MTKKNIHTAGKDPVRPEVLRRLEKPFTTSKDAAWDAISARISRSDQDDSGQTATGKVRKLSVSIHWYAAASIFLLLGISFFLRYFAVEIQATQSSSFVELPGGSTAELRNGSMLKYHPLWWPVKRISRLEGTAVFDVQKGKAFRVNSTLGTTEVLGTRFEISAGSSDYTVSCYSGSVKVSAPSGKTSATLQPNEKVTIDPEGKFNIQYIEIKPQESKTGQKEYISFNGASVYEVFDALEKHYGVTIDVQEGLEQIYSGNITSDNALEAVLAAVCIPLGLTYEKNTQHRYIITRGP